MHCQTYLYLLVATPQYFIINASKVIIIVSRIDVINEMGGFFVKKNCLIYAWFKCSESKTKGFRRSVETCEYTIGDWNEQPLIRHWSAFFALKKATTSKTMTNTTAQAACFPELIRVGSVAAPSPPPSVMVSPSIGIQVPRDHRHSRASSQVLTILMAAHIPEYVLTQVP